LSGKRKKNLARGKGKADGRLPLGRKRGGKIDKKKKNGGGVKREIQG